MILVIPDELFNDEEKENTPGRFRRFIEEWTNKSQDFHITKFPTPDCYDQIIAETNIPFYSLCSHHLLPFYGRAHIGYIPAPREENGFVFGLSKLARIVDKFAKRPQMQERLTPQILNFIVKEINPKGAMVVLEAEHFCMTMRGVNKPGATCGTSAVHGLFTEDSVKQEFLEMIKISKSRV